MINNGSSASVIILLEMYITYRYLLLMAYITVWDAAIDTRHVQIVLLSGGRESLDTMSCSFFGECAEVCHFQDR